MAHSDGKPNASQLRYRQFQERQQRGPALSLPGPARVVAAAKVAFNTWKGYVDAAQGWCQAAAENGYSLENVVPDMLAFHAGWYGAARDVCDVLCHEPATLETDEDSESAGPLTVALFSGVAADLLPTAPTSRSGATIPVGCIMLRVRAGALRVSLVGFKESANRLAADTYRGEIRMRDGGKKIADLVVVHRRKGRNPRLTFRSGP